MSLNKLTGAVLLALASQAATASGFALIEQSASGQGLSYAGAAANAEDASIMWFNAAGLTELDANQAILAGHIVLPKTKFTNTGSAPFTASESNAGQNALIPNVYWKGKYLGYDVGFGINAPFGSKIEYSPNWAGKADSISTDLKSVNFNGNIAKKLNNDVSVGFGLNAQYVNLDMNQFFSAGTNLATIKADSWALGFNLGLLAQVSDDTTLGMSYRSEMKHNARGSADFGGIFFSSAQANVTLPASLMFSVKHQANDKMALLADATWTGWKAYDELVINYGTGAPVSSSETNQNMGDSMRYSLGMTYQYDSKWKLRAGVARDLTPVPDASSRSTRTPDSDRTWASVGFNYKLKNNLDLDVGYSHIIGDEAGINRTTSGPTSIVGDYESSVDILSAQMVWKY